MSVICRMTTGNGQSEIAQATAKAGFLKIILNGGCLFKKNGNDFWDANGYITFNIIKQIDLQFGHDKNFIGNGYRSLFLSDFSPNYLFAKINTRVWRLQYTNLFAKINPFGHYGNGNKY